MMASNAGFVWLFGLTVLFGLVIINMFIIPSIKTYMYPIIIENLPDADRADITPRIDFIFFVWRTFTFTLMFAVVIYMFVAIYSCDEVPVG